MHRPDRLGKQPRPELVGIALILVASKAGLAPKLVVPHHSEDAPIANCFRLQ